MYKLWIDFFVKSAVFALLFSNCSLLCAEEWVRIDGQTCVIEYEGQVNLLDIDRKLDLTSIGARGLKRDLIGLPPSGRLTKKIEIIAQKVRQILNMHPIGYEVQIKIFENRKSLQDCYENLFGHRKNIISFYVYKHNTIYTNQKDISEHVMAHELAHSIIDHYFVILPPENISEMLAIYVDMHLND